MPPTPEYQRAYRYRKGKAVHEYLLIHPCVDCGEADPIVLDFDHVRGEKKANVKRMLAGTYSLKRVFDEIAKCDVRCANCHRRATAQRGGFFAYLTLDLPERPKRERVGCGTRTKYQRQGCRCAECCAANNQAAARHRQTRRDRLAASKSAD